MEITRRPVSRPAGRGIPLAGGDYQGGRRGAREVRAASVVLLPCVPSSVAVARGRIAADLRRAGLIGGTIADAALVLSELLSNAILHAHPLPDERVRVAWVLSPAVLEVLVSDGGGVTWPHPAPPSLSSIGGRGLSIVEHLCSSWGVRGDERGTTVWAILPAPRASAENPGRAAVTAARGGPAGTAPANGASAP